MIQGVKIWNEWPHARYVRETGHDLPLVGAVQIDRPRGGVPRQLDKPHLAQRQAVSGPLSPHQHPLRPPVESQVIVEAEPERRAVRRLDPAHDGSGAVGLQGEQADGGLRGVGVQHDPGAVVGLDPAVQATVPVPVHEAVRPVLVRREVLEGIEPSAVGHGGVRHRVGGAGRVPDADDRRSVAFVPLVHRGLHVRAVVVEVLPEADDLVEQLLTDVRPSYHSEGDD